MENKLQLLKPRNFSEVINDMFTFARQNMGALLRAMLIVVMPFAIFGGLFFSQYLSSIFALTRNGRSDTSSLLQGAGAMALNLLLCFSGIMFAAVCMQLIVISLFLQYETAEAEVPKVGGLLKRFKNSILRFLGLTLVLIFLFIAAYFLIILLAIVLGKAAGAAVLGLLMFGMILVFIYVAIPFSLVPIIYMREHDGFTNAISRAFFLAKGHWWQTFGVIIITQIIINFASMIFVIPFYAYYFIAIFHSIKSGLPPAFETSLGSTIAGAFMTVGITVLSSLLPISVTIQYYSLVERKDGESTMREIEKIGASENPAI